MRPVTLQTDLNRYEDIPLKRLHPIFVFICKFEKSKAKQFSPCQNLLDSYNIAKYCAALITKHKIFRCGRQEFISTTLSTWPNSAVWSDTQRDP